MGKIRPSEAALLFVGMLYSDPGVFGQAKTSVERNFGEILWMVPPVPWEYSTHYRDELGWPITRQFLFIRGLFDTGRLAEVKLGTNGIETSLSAGGKRRVNLDPGYVTLAKVVLASTKNYSHRVYLGKGIYAEVTLIYHAGERCFAPHLFTYRDYREKRCIDMFVEARGILAGMSA